MKILWYSDSPFVPSGYGRIAEQLLPRLHFNGHEILIQPKFGHHGKPINLGYAVMFGVTAKDSFDMVGINAKNFNVDVVILCVEIWAVDVPTLRKRLPRTVIVSYLPNDTEHLSKRSINHLKNVDFIIPMSNHCRTLLKNCKEIPDEKVSDVIYPPIPAVFSPMEGVGMNHITGMHFDCLIGMVQMSKDILRKDQIRQMWAVKKAADVTGKKVGLYLHMHPTAAFDVVKAGEEIDFEENLIVPLEEAYLTGFTDMEMARVYNSIDFLIECTIGEGFGMPTAEAILCGTPVVGVLNTATKELVESTYPGFAVPANETTVFRGLYDKIANFDKMVEKTALAIEMACEGGKGIYRGDELKKLTNPDQVTVQWEHALTNLIEMVVNKCSIAPGRSPDFVNTGNQEVVVSYAK